MSTNHKATIKRWRKRKDSLGKRFRAARESRGLTRAALAQAAQLTADAIYKIETGQRFPQLGTTIQIAAALGKTPEEMLR